MSKGRRESIDELIAKDPAWTRTELERLERGEPNGFSDVLQARAEMERLRLERPDVFADLMGVLQRSVAREGWSRPRRLSSMAALVLGEDAPKVRQADDGAAERARKMRARKPRGA